MTTQTAPATELDALDLTVVQETDDAAQEDSLYFPPEAAVFQTPFRSCVYQMILDEANRIAPSEIESFSLSAWSYPGEEDAWALCMTIFINSGWDRVRTLRTALLDCVNALSRNWSAAQLEDYQKRIHFEVFPNQP